MDFEAGDVVRHKDGEQKMTILRFVGDEENDAMNMMDHQLSSKGFQSGSPMCEWFEGTAVKTATFHARDLLKVELEEKAGPESEEEELPPEEEPAKDSAEDTNEESQEEEDEFNFDDEDFDF